MISVTVRLGAHDKNGRAPQDYNIRHLDVHDSYDINYQKPVNDIAIITLARPVQFTGKFLCIYHSFISIFILSSHRFDLFILRDWFAKSRAFLESLISVDIVL